MPAISGRHRGEAASPSDASEAPLPNGRPVDGLLLALAVQSIGEDLDGDGILRRTVELSCAVTGAEHAMLGLNDPDGVAGDLAALITHGDPALLGDGHALALPLLVDSTVFGTLHVGGRPRPFAGRDVQTLDVLLRAAGAALGHARVRRGLVHDLQRTLLELREGAPVDKVRVVVDEYAELLGLRPELRFSETGAALPEDAIGDVLAVLRAALANVHEHARASRVEVEFDVSAHWVMLTVTDDGVGVALDHGEGRGLADMRARAQRRGGVVRLGPNTPRGTAVSWLVPA